MPHSLDRRLHFVGTYWVRKGAPGGNSWKLKRLPVLSQDSKAQQFIAYALQKNQKSLSTVISSLADKGEIDLLMEEVCNSGLSALLFDIIMELQMHDACQSLVGSQGLSLASVLCSQYAYLTADFARGDYRFVELLERLADFNDSVVWLKGTVFARNLYEKPWHRFAGDLDLVIRPESCLAFLKRLSELGFELAWEGMPLPGKKDDGMERALAGPCKETEYTNEISANRSGWSLIEIKFDLLKSGLYMKEAARFFGECTTVSWASQSFKAPSRIDHLMLVLFNMHRRSFHSLWPWLYDVHLLAAQMEKDDWREFSRRCLHEGIGLSAWAGLDLAISRLGTAVPDEVLSQLAPTRSTIIDRLLTFVVGSRFVWHEKSIFGLLANIAFLGDGRRKWAVLARCFFPGRRFLQNYYNDGAPLNIFKAAIWLLFHWYLLFFAHPCVRTTLR